MWDRVVKSRTTVPFLKIVSADGVDVNPGSDKDADLITVGVSGTPKVYWDESEEQFHSTKGFYFDTDIALLGGTIFSKVAGQRWYTLGSDNSYIEMVGYNGAVTQYGIRVQNDTTGGNLEVGFFNTTPVAQLAKASYQNWGAFTDVVNALVDIGLLDTA